MFYNNILQTSPPRACACIFHKTLALMLYLLPTHYTGSIAAIYDILTTRKVRRKINSLQMP